MPKQEQAKWLYYSGGEVYKSSLCGAFTTINTEIFEEILPLDCPGCKAGMKIQEV